MQGASAIYRSDEEVSSLDWKDLCVPHRWQKVVARASEYQTVDGSAGALNTRRA